VHPRQEPRAAASQKARPCHGRAWAHGHPMPSSTPVPCGTGSRASWHSRTGANSRLRVCSSFFLSTISFSLLGEAFSATF